MKFRVSFTQSYETSAVVEADRLTAEVVDKAREIAEHHDQWSPEGFIVLQEVLDDDTEAVVDISDLSLLGTGVEFRAY